MGCFINAFFWMAACIILAIWSEAPPAPAATTISTGLEGSHATAGTAVSASKARVLHLPNFMTPPKKGPRVYPRMPKTVGSSRDRKSTRLNSSHLGISYAVFCLKKKRAAFDVRHRAILPDVREPNAIQGCAKHEFHVIDDERTVDRHGYRLRALLGLPSVDL